jgi:hypothetical protein
MKKFFLICLCALFSQTIYSQSTIVQEDETQRFQNMLTTSAKTMVINTVNISQNTIEKFQLELDGWKEKVISSQIDTVQHTFTIIHYKLLHPIEMETFLNKYQIKSQAIISYN